MRKKCSRHSLKHKEALVEGNENREKRSNRANVGLIIGMVCIVIAAIAAFFLSREMEKRTYRMVYPTLIGQYAEEFQLDPYLVAAVIHTESGNRPDAVSSSGAVGLMQVMPETGEWIAGKLGVHDFTTQQLYDPKTNIRFGCWYLAFLKERFEGDRPLMLAAYNAGHGNVAKWLEDPEISQDGQLVNIPFGETERYVEKVQRAYEKYQTLYPKQW